MVKREHDSAYAFAWKRINSQRRCVGTKMLRSIRTLVTRDAHSKRAHMAGSFLWPNIEQSPPCKSTQEPRDFGKHDLMTKLLDLFDGCFAIMIVLFLKIRQTLLVRTIEASKQQTLFAFVLSRDRHHANVIVMLIHVAPRKRHVSTSEFRVLLRDGRVSFHVQNVPANFGTCFAPELSHLS